MKQHFGVLVTGAYGADNNTLVAAIKKESDAEIASLRHGGAKPIATSAWCKSWPKDTTRPNNPSIFYLLSNPSDKDKREVQDRIYGLSAKRKLSC